MNNTAVGHNLNYGNVKMKSESLNLSKYKHIGNPSEEY